MSGINELREGISNSKGVAGVIALMQEGKREEAMNIVKVSDELKEKFWEIFTNYYIENKEKLDEHAKIFGEIFGFKSSKDDLFHQQLIFALYLNNTVSDFSKNMGIIGCSFDFVQLVTEYINKDNLLKTFPKCSEIQNFSGVDIRGEEGMKIVNKLFTAMKKKFSLSSK